MSTRILGIYAAHFGTEGISVSISGSSFPCIVENIAPEPTNEELITKGTDGNDAIFTAWNFGKALSCDITPVGTTKANALAALAAPLIYATLAFSGSGVPTDLTGTWYFRKAQGPNMSNTGNANFKCTLFQPPSGSYTLITS